MRPALALCLLLAACARPLTPAETGFAAGLFGDSFDPGPVRMVADAPVGLIERTRPVRPRTTCRERILPPPEGDTVTGRTAGIAGFQRVYTSQDWSLPDYLDGLPERIHLVAAMFFAHEMTHVWQWQNRDLTGYHPLRAAREHSRTRDPYLFDPQSDAPFLSFGYEQQASLVEEYVCCRAMDPGGARTARLAEKLSEVMDLAPHDPGAEGPEVWLPWTGGETENLCS